MKAVEYLKKKFGDHNAINDDSEVTRYTNQIKLNPSNAGGYFLRGNEYYVQEKYNLAIADYTKAIELDSNNSENYIRRGQVYYAQNQYDLAIADCTKVMDLDPKCTTLGYVDAYLTRAKAYSNQGNYSNALDDYNVLIRLSLVVSYKNEYSYAGRAWVHQQLGKLKRS